MIEFKEIDKKERKLTILAVICFLVLVGCIIGFIYTDLIFRIFFCILALICNIFGYKYVFPLEKEIKKLKETQFDFYEKDMKPTYQIENKIIAYFHCGNCFPSHSEKIVVGITKEEEIQIWCENCKSNVFK